jgi:hypothetical protein
MVSKALSLAKLLGDNNKLSTDTFGDDVSTIEQASSTDVLTNLGNAVGDQRLVGSNLYIWNGTGWYRIALINQTPTWDSGGQPSGSYVLDADSPQDATVITLAASDPDGLPISYSYVTSGSMDSMATISQDSSIFTITPKTVAQVGEGVELTGSITFRASDGVNILPSVSSFTLSFITSLENSRYTTLLATAVDTSDNNNITDSSTSNHTITVTGDAHAGTFSPYRHGGYSTYFDGNGDYIGVGSAIVPTAYDTDYTIEMWIYPTTTGSREDIFNQYAATASGRMAININTDATISFFQNGLSPAETKSSAISANNWYHLAVVNSSGTRSFYVNGSLIGTATGTASMYNGNTEIGRLGDVGSNYFTGYITDVRVVNGTAVYTGSFTPPTDRLTAVANTSLLTCHLPYIADGSSSAHSITVNGDTSTKPFTPYDNLEYAAADHGGSVVFDGSGDYLTYSAGNEIGFSTGDFTVEFWAYNKFSTGSLQKIIETRTASNWIIQIASTNHFQWYNGSTTVFNYDISYTKNTWAHFVVTRDGTTLRLFVNGRLVSTTTDSVSYSVSSGTVYISRRYNDNLDYFSGYLTDLRIVKGSVVTEYQTSSTTTDTQIFTPPTAPLTAITDTSLLISGTDASIIDKSQTSNLKLVGNTTGSTAQAKFANTKSMYFDGNGDSVFVPYESIPSFGIIEFTIEGWIYMNNLTGNQLIVDKWVSGNSQGFQFYHRSTGSSLTFYVGNVIVVQDPSSSSISAQTWHHVAVTRDSGANVRLYVDGLKKAQSFSPVSLDNTLPLRLGASATSTNYFNGYMQDVRLSNKALYTADDESSNIPSEPLKG